MQEIGIKEIDCTNVYTSFRDCEREFHEKDECVHAQDLIVECINVKNKTDIEKGSLRLLNIAGEITTNGVGVLQIYMNGNWNTINNILFSANSATVACKQMKFEKGILLEDCTDVTVEDKNIKNINLCGKNMGQYVHNWRCNGSEKKLLECGLAEIPFSIHEKDVVLDC